MTDIDLRSLALALPLCAEEGPYREVVPESELIAALVGTSSHEKALGAVSTLRRMFEAFGLLDTAELARSNWAFASFPAYLMGRSLLEAFATPDLSLFYPGYWQHEGHKPDNVIEEQRRLLAELEGRRVRFHPAADPLPIRFVFVAWGLIRIGNDFLLVHREDKSRPDARNFVFPGGRFHVDDLPPKERNAEVLRRIHSADIEWMVEALSRTLSRELDEELNLRLSADYYAMPIVTLKPYRKIEGARNNHAYTEYHIRLFNIALTPEGEARMLDQVAGSPELAWFRLEDLTSTSGRADGKSAFIDALRDEYGDKLPEMLAAIPDSSGTPYRLTGETHAVDLPVTPGATFRVGKTGKEKDVPITLTQQEHALLVTLVAHARGIEPAAVAEHVRLLGGGWIKMVSEIAITTAATLAQRLADAQLPLVQIAAGSFVRVAIDPAIAYFSEAAYRYQLNGYKLQVDLALSLMPWADQLDLGKCVELDPTLTLVIRAIHDNGSLWKGDKIIEGKDTDREFRDKLDKQLRPIGLRKLIRTNLEDYVISVPYSGA